MLKVLVPNGRLDEASVFPQHVFDFIDMEGRTTFYLY